MDDFLLPTSCIPKMLKTQKKMPDDVVIVSEVVRDKSDPLDHSDCNPEPERSEHSERNSERSEHSEHNSERSEHSERNSERSEHSERNSEHSEHSDRHSEHSDHSEQHSELSDHSDDSVHSERDKAPGETVSQNTLKDIQIEQEDIQFDTEKKDIQIEEEDIQLDTEQDAIKLDTKQEDTQLDTAQDSNAVSEEINIDLAEESNTLDEDIQKLSNEHTIKELRDMCKSKGINTQGKKVDLARRYLTNSSTEIDIEV